MSKKTLTLISVLVIVTVVLFFVALQTGDKTAPSNKEQALSKMSPAPTSPAHSVLTISPNPLFVQTGQIGKAEVMLNTSDNAVTAVQLEVAYDPNIITNVKVTPGPLFPNAVILIDKNRIPEGRYTYAFGISPSNPTIKGTGVVATISFTAKNVPGEQSQLALLPTTLITARGVASSVLKSATGTLLNVTANTAAAGTETIRTTR